MSAEDPLHRLGPGPVGVGRGVPRGPAAYVGDALRRARIAPSRSAVATKSATTDARGTPTAASASAQTTPCGPCRRRSARPPPPRSRDGAQCGDDRVRPVAQVAEVRAHRGSAGRGVGRPARAGCRRPRRRSARRPRDRASGGAPRPGRRPRAGRGPSSTSMPVRRSTTTRTPRPRPGGRRRARELLEVVRAHEHARRGAPPSATARPPRSRTFSRRRGRPAPPSLPTSCLSRYGGGRDGAHPGERLERREHRVALDPAGDEDDARSGGRRRARPARWRGRWTTCWTPYEAPGRARRRRAGP